MDAKSPIKPISDKGVRPVPFHAPAKFLNDLDAATTAEIVAAAADVALLVEDGVVKDVALGPKALIDEGYDTAWRGKPWVETVTAESRNKIEELLSAVKGGERWRQVNHPSHSPHDTPIKYTAVQIGSTDKFIALGREQGAVAALQQRLIEAHQNLERDYARMREAQARYRLLFAAVSDPLLIVEARNLSIEDANPAAAKAVQTDLDDLRKAALPELFQGTERRTLDVLVAEAIAAGQAHLPCAALHTGATAAVTASAFREDRATRLIVRLLSAAAPDPDTAARRSLLAVLDRLPDGLVIADASQRIVAANETFNELAKLSGDARALGRQLHHHLGRSGTDLNVLFAALKKHGVVRNFATIVRDRFGDEEPVEVSAVAAPLGEDDIYAFSIRGIARRLPTIGADERLPATAGRFTELVGHVPLKDIVRESTLLIEKLCIEAALEITDNNRASAAEILGLSRQGLYSKLKRSGLDEAE